ncbi:MAG: diguanylate cyclase [Burkholderiales bacterium]|nr:diguanylate cyclase [Burkholderiales bacterium]
MVHAVFDNRTLDKLIEVLDVMPTPTAFIDHALRLKFANQAGAAWLNQPAAKLYGTQIEELVDPVIFERMAGYLRRALSGSPQHFSGGILQSSGRPALIAAHFVPYRGADDGIEGVFIFLETQAEYPLMSAQRARNSHDRNSSLIAANARLQKEVAIHRRAESLLDAEKQNMELICAGKNLQSVLEKLCETAERFSQGGRCAILIVEPGRHGLLRDITASLPASFVKTIRELLSDKGQRMGSPAFHDQPVYVEDIVHDPAWTECSALAVAHDIRSAWLMPIVSASGDLLGTLTLYYRTRRRIPRLDQVLVKRICHLAALAFQHNKSAQQLNYLATHDALTELPNRHLFHTALGRAIAKARRASTPFALMFIDLDRFKQVNDRLGHDIGDHLLQHIAKRLSACVRREDTISRLGGDEFTVIIEDFRDERDVLAVAHKVQSILSSPFQIQRHELRVSCSIGIALFPQHGDDAEALLKNADTAMYFAKELGRNNYQSYAPDMSGFLTAGTLAAVRQREDGRA